MANLDELIQKLSEKSKALTYDSGRWDSTQLAKKTKELTELLPEILNGIIDAIPESEAFLPIVDLTGLGVDTRIDTEISGEPVQKLERGYIPKLMVSEQGDYKIYYPVMDVRLTEAVRGYIEGKTDFIQCYSVGYYLEGNVLDSGRVLLFYQNSSTKKYGLKFIDA